MRRIHAKRINFEYFFILTPKTHDPDILADAGVGS